MATTKAQQLETEPRPLIQIDDIVREMTEEEYAIYQLEMSDILIIPEDPSF
jgi:hypothetical protein